MDAICQADPENVEALETLVRCRRAARLDISQEALGNLLALEGKTSKKDAAPAWSRLLRQSRQALSCGQFEMAEQLVHQVLLAEPATPLPSLTHLLVENQRGLPVQSICSLAELYHGRWPNCVQFTLILAKALMELGESDRGVELLHQAVAMDVSGQVAQRLWGSQHSYLTLWPDPLESTLTQDLTLPPNVAATMGWNQLPASVSAQETAPQKVEQVEEPAVPAHPAKSALDAEGIVETSPDEIKSPFFELGAEKPEPAKPVAPVPAKPFVPEPAVPVVPEPAKPVAPEPAKPAQPEAVKPVSSGPDMAEQSPRPRLQTYVPEALRSIQEELERVALNLKQPHLAKGDGRFPIYVILSSRQGLETQYGKQASQAVHAAMLGLVEAVKSRKEWGALLYLCG